TALPPRMTLMLGALAGICATALVFFHLPLPWVSDEPFALPAIYLLGVWFSLLVALGVIGAYAWQIAEEARLLADALAATEQVVAPHRNFGVAIDVTLPASRADEPVGQHNPAIIYGLGNLVENAVDFARERVEIAAHWSDGEVVIAIADDGPGFAAQILDR